MNKQEALNLIGDRAKWELQHMKKALSMFPILNTEEDDKRLEAVKTLLKS